MAADTNADHWDGVYGSRPLDSVSWHQAEAATSRRLITMVAGPQDSVIDVGAGASTLAEELLDDGWSDVTVLDVSARALEEVRARLRHRSGVGFVVADLLGWDPERSYDVWHDRAVFHFLTEAEQRQAYVATALRALGPGGALVLGAFAADGPTSCSGLPTARYDVEELVAQLGPAFELVHSEREEHRTPAGAVQPFTWVVLRRR
jgi:SAM-dependent methyltransferase